MERCSSILREHADLLVALAEYLLINESMDGDDFAYFCDHKRLPPLPGTEEKKPAQGEGIAAGDKPAEPPAGGSEEETN